MTRWVLAAAMFTAVGWLTGCATMIYGTTQSISVTSEPVGAEVWTKGQFLATTPTTLTLRRKSDYDIEIKKEGFEVARVRLESKSEHDAPSILLGGPIGWGIDVSTGGNKRLYPESVHVVLRALPLPVAAISFETQRAQLEALKAKGTITEEEYTVMRRRLVESVSAATPVPSSKRPTRSAPRDRLTNLVGRAEVTTLDR